VSFATFGSPVGGYYWTCPGPYSGWQCIKETNVFAETECVDRDKCDFEVEDYNYHNIKFTSGLSEWRMCRTPKALNTLFTCKCSNDDKKLDSGGLLKRKSEADARRKKRDGEFPCRHMHWIRIHNGKGKYVTPTNEWSWVVRIGNLNANNSKV